MSVQVGLLKDPFSAVSHFVGFVAALAGMGYLVSITAHDPARLVVATLYGVGLSVVFLASTLYHSLDLGQRGNRRLNQFDHVAIFLMIGGSYLPPTLQLLEGPWRLAVLALVVAATAGGALLKALWFDCPLWLSVGVYLVFGWASLVPLGQMLPLLSPPQVWLLLGGGLSYTVGAVVYATERPDPWPAVFGHHELWHLFVLAGAGCHFWFNADILRQASPPF